MLDLNCRDCTQELKKERGCTEKGLVPFRFNDENLYRCPRTLINSQTWGYLHAYRFYRKNMLPSNGSFLMESRKYLTAMSIIDDEIEKSQIDKLKGKNA